MHNTAIWVFHFSNSMDGGVFAFTRSGRVGASKRIGWCITWAGGYWRDTILSVHRAESSLGEVYAASLPYGTNVVLYIRTGGEAHGGGVADCRPPPCRRCELWPRNTLSRYLLFCSFQLPCYFSYVPMSHNVT